MIYTEWYILNGHKSVYSIHAGCSSSLYCANAHVYIDRYCRLWAKILDLVTILEKSLL